MIIKRHFHRKKPEVGLTRHPSKARAVFRAQPQPGRPHTVRMPQDSRGRGATVIFLSSAALFPTSQGPQPVLSKKSPPLKVPAKFPVALRPVAAGPPRGNPLGEFPVRGLLFRGIYPSEAKSLLHYVRIRQGSLPSIFHIGGHPAFGAGGVILLKPLPQMLPVGEFMQKGDFHCPWSLFLFM